VPQSQRAIAAARNDIFAVRREGDRMDLTCLSPEVANERALARLPELHCAVWARTAGKKSRAVRRKCERDGAALMPLEAAKQRTRCRVPQPYRLVPAPGNDASAIGGKCHRVDAFPMSLQRAQERAGGRVP